MSSGKVTSNGKGASGKSVDKLLQDVRDGTIEMEEAKQQLNLLALDEISGIASLDPRRKERTGVPEVVYADTKEPEDTAAIAWRLLDSNGQVFITRAQGELHETLLELFRKRLDEDNSITIHSNPKAGIIRLRTRNKSRGRKNGNGKVGIITAGTSDIPVAEEARETVEFMGCTAITAYDIGIAGIHRLFAPLKEMLEENVRVISVMAGMEGALPSVVASLVDVPVIGVPCSVGSGYGGKGEAALMSMLQSCSPGLVVVNIDNGFGAGVSAALMAREAKE